MCNWFLLKLYGLLNIAYYVECVDEVVLAKGFNYKLTHLPLDKMAAISQTTFLNAFSWMNSFVFWISLKFVPKGPIDNTTALVQVMAWRRTGDKPLPEPMMTQFTHVYMQHWEEMS